MPTTPISAASRARGVLLGQAIGDNLGSVAEFSTPAQLTARYPSGVRELAGGARYGWTVLAPGQPTDDTELALALARSLVRCGGYRESDVRESYRRWADSGPFDMGNTCAQALTPPYQRSESSQSNGSLMRVSPLAVACAPSEAGHFALVDASLTHANPYPARVNACYAAALSDVVAGVEPGSPGEQAGLKPGDVITRLNDRPIDSADALIAATRSKAFGETVTLQVQREGESQPVPVEVTLSSE